MSFASTALSMTVKPHPEVPPVLLESGMDRIRACVFLPTVPVQRRAWAVAPMTSSRVLS